jgi:hypothetical protein
MPDHAAGSPPAPGAPDRISSDRVLEILQREPLGAALLRAAIAEASCEVLQAQIDELKKRQQHDPAA